MTIDVLLNRDAGKPVLLAVKPADGGTEVTETVEPIDLGAENTLAYKRWVAKRRALVEKLSGSRSAISTSLDCSVPSTTRSCLSGADSTVFTRRK